MKRAKWLILLMLLATAGVWAQTVSSITIGTTITSGPAPTFYVDGTPYTTPQIFLWPQGSKHVVFFPEDLDPSQTPLGYQSSGYPYFLRWNFGGWKDSQGLLVPASLPSQTITADPSVTSYTASITVSYLLTILYSSGLGVNPDDCFGAPGDAPQDGPRQGVFYVNGTCHIQGTQIWLAAGPITLNAFPYPGFAFAGWVVNGQPLNPYLTQFNLTASTILSPQFVAAKRVQFRTSPLGLSVVVDHGVVATPSTAGPQQYTGANSCVPSSSAISGAAPIGYTPLCSGDFDFLPGSSHQIAAATPQQDSQGNFWVFSGFSNGGGQNNTYVTDNDPSTPDTVTANFNPGVQATFFTLPGGLPLTIDGRSDWLSYTFVWSQGESHTVSAPPTLTDSKGNVYSFVGWNNGGAATQTITMPTGTSTFLMWATYQPEGQTQITSNPVGLTFTVNNASCTTPCIVNSLGGQAISASIPSTLAPSPGTRYDFDSWSNGSTSTSLKVTSTAGLQVIVANYRTSYLLVSSASPAGSTTLVTSPPSRDGYYPAGTGITVTETARSGFKFWHWSGDYTLTDNVAYLVMNQPHSVTAVSFPVNTPQPAATINAAGPTPDGSVAPGSLISIFGQGVGPSSPVVGPTNPLEQGLAGVSVTAGNLFFPLWFVSSGQINAQVPWELAPGDYTLTVHVAGQADVTGPLTVSRNAPGIYYTQPTGSQPQAVAVHQNWTLVTPSSPAQRNEYVTIYVNGLGPVSPAGIDGFPAPINPLSPTVDGVTVTINGALTVTPYWAGASPGTNGTGVVILQITNQIPSATVLNLKVNVNGKSSTSVQLPVQ